MPEVRVSVAVAFAVSALLAFVLPAFAQTDCPGTPVGTGGPLTCVTGDAAPSSVPPLSPAGFWGVFAVDAHSYTADLWFAERTRTYLESIRSATSRAGRTSPHGAERCHPARVRGSSR